MRSRLTLAALALVAVACTSPAVCPPPGTVPAGTTPGTVPPGTTSTSTPATTTPPAAGVGLPPGTVLAAFTGDRDITQAGTVIDGADIEGTLTISAPGVVIRRSRFTGTGQPFAVRVTGGHVRIEDSLFTGNYEAAAVVFSDFEIVRTEFTGLPGDGVKLGSRTLLADSWMHDFASAPGAHADGAQMQDGSVDVVVRDNRILLTTGQNAALFIAPDLGPSTDGPVTITGNELAGGNYTVYLVDGNNGEFFVANITFTGNRFVRGTARYGPLSINVPVTRANNVWTDTGATV